MTRQTGVRPATFPHAKSLLLLAIAHKTPRLTRSVTHLAHLFIYLHHSEQRCRLRPRPPAMPTALILWGTLSCPHHNIEYETAEAPQADLGAHSDVSTFSAFCCETWNQSIIDSETSAMPRRTMASHKFSVPGNLRAAVVSCRGRRAEEAGYRTSSAPRGLFPAFSRILHLLVDDQPVMTRFDDYASRPTIRSNDMSTDLTVPLTASSCHVAS